MFAVRRHLSCAVALALLIPGGFAASLGAEEIKKDVPYVPTPEPVVEKMLDLVKPQKGEVLYDLGCGDGRIVVTAAKKYGVKGIGVDIDPERIAESNANAEEAGVTDQVKFVRGDLFKMDFHDANVVTLYLLTSVNEKLKPKLLEQLKPGSRVVSHAFSMGDWEPDQEVTVEPGGQTVYFWVIPAKVDGTWTLKLPGDNQQQATLKLKQQYQNVTGSAMIGGKQSELKDAKLNGAEFTFTLAASDGKAQKYTAKVDGDTMKGTAGDGEFTAQRQGGEAKAKGKQNSQE